MKYLIEYERFDGLERDPEFIIIHANSDDEMFNNWYELNIDYTHYKVYRYVENMGYIAFKIAPKS